MVGGVGKRVGAEEGLFMGVYLWGTHGVRPYGTRDEGALLSLNFHLSTLISQPSSLNPHLNSLQERFLIHDFYAEFLRLFEF